MSIPHLKARAEFYALVRLHVTEHLSYDDATGQLIYKKRPANCVRVGDVAGHERRDGYIGLSVFGKEYLAHRIIWLMVNGCYPEEEIDHINGIRSDNRLANLRIVGHGENSRNTKLYKNNSTGHVGIHYRRDTGKYRAYIRSGKNRLYLGCFLSFDDAVEARRIASKTCGFHENHGRTAADRDAAVSAMMRREKR